MDRVALAITVALGLPVASTAASALERDAALTAAIQEGMQQASIPGVIVGVWQDGVDPYVQAFGVRDTASGQPMTTDLHMRIGSVTKTFVVTAILQLVDQGKIGLDDPIEKYVPGVPRGDVITIRQLAAMRSGLYSYTNEVIPNLASNPTRQWTLPELLAISFGRRCPVLFEPGAEFDYSNTNTLLLGLVVEKVSGQRLEDYLHQHFLQPEGLAHTVFPADASIPSPHAEGYTETPDGQVVNATAWNPSWGWAAGQMISTLDDLHTWTLILATGKLVSPALQREREEFLPAPQEGEGAMYGLGLENDNGWIGHNGNIPGYLTFAFHLPSRQTTMVVLFNSSINLLGTAALMREMTKIISPDNLWPEPPKPPVPPSALTFTIVNGEYFLNWTEGVLQSSDSLLGTFCRVEGATSPYPMVPDANVTFYGLDSY